MTRPNPDYGNLCGAATNPNPHIHTRFVARGAKLTSYLSTCIYGLVRFREVFTYTSCK